MDVTFKVFLFTLLISDYDFFDGSHLNFIAPGAIKRHLIVSMRNRR